MTVIGVSWMKGDMGYMKTFPAIVLKEGDYLKLELNPVLGNGKYQVITMKNGISTKGLQIFETSFPVVAEPTWSKTPEKAMYDKPPRDVDQYDYLLEEK